MDKYNLEYKGVICTGADWEKDPYEFELTYKGNVYLYKQKRYISQSADTDHIRCVIKQFLEDAPPRTQFERIKAMSIDEMAGERIREYTADNDGGYTYFCGDYDERDYPQYYFTNLFICKDKAKERAIQAEIKWLESEVSE